MMIDTEIQADVLRVVSIEGNRAGHYWPATDLPARPGAWYVKAGCPSDTVRVVDSSADAMQFIVDEYTRRNR